MVKEDNKEKVSHWYENLVVTSAMLLFIIIFLDFNIITTKIDYWPFDRTKFSDAVFIKILEITNAFIFLFYLILTVKYCVDEKNKDYESISVALSFFVLCLSIKEGLLFPFFSYMFQF